jgi:hypothetical protein
LRLVGGAIRDIRDQSDRGSGGNLEFSCQIFLAFATAFLDSPKKDALNADVIRL